MVANNDKTGNIPQAWLPTMLWVGRSTNDKTGDIPQGYVGATREETNESCKGCPLRDTSCYHWKGTPRMGQASMQRAHAKGKDYTLSTAIGASRRLARYVRGAVGGDPAIFARETVASWVDEIRLAGLNGLLLYTHFWKTRGSHLRGLAMASCDTLEQADEAVDAGWRAAVTLPVKAKGSKHNRVAHLPVWGGPIGAPSPKEFVTPKGRRVVVCPAQRDDLNKDCNTCGLCDPTDHENVPVIGFLQH